MVTSRLALILTLAGCGPTGLETGADTGGPGPAPLDADADGFSVDEGDCDDADPTAYPGAPEACDGADDDCDGAADEELLRTWYPDLDEDGYGDDASAPVRACAAPEGMVEDNRDCNDLDPDWNPGADESDCTDPNDYNCDGSVAWADTDADGWAACLECNDADAAVFPGATEACNGLDDDCDGTVDGPAAPGWRTWHPDADADGHGATDGAVEACEPPPGHVEDATDCNDADAAFHPGAPETDCTDPNDYDCDGVVAWADADADAWAACVDCDDADAAVRPDATESCNLRDDDCDGTTDEDDAVDAPTWYADTDADGYGTVASELRACAAPAMYVASADDCDDASATVSPAATETCNAIDDDCDGTADEDDAVDAPTWHADADADGYGDPAAAYAACARPDGYVTNAEDADDTDDDVYPGAPVLAFSGTLEASSTWTARLTWEAGGWRAGYGLTTVDDIDGDGVRDLVIGARGTPSDTYGSVFVHSGATSGDTWLSSGRLRLKSDKYTPSPAWLTDIGGGYVAVATAGDNTSEPGAVFVLDASATGNSALKDVAIRIEATSEDAFSEAGLAPWGASSGRRGLAAASPSEGILAVWDASRLTSGSRADAPIQVDLSGYMGTTAQVRLADVGDTDGDGIHELAVGLPQRQSSGSLDGYVFLVSQDLAAGSHALADVGTSMTDSGGRAGFGHLVAATGDLDGDGLADLAASTTGATYVLSGAAFGSGLAAATLTTIDGSAWALLGNLNLDGDDDDDLIVGLAYEDVGTLTQAGWAEVHLGPLTDGGTRDTTTADAVFTGSVSGDGMGWALAGIPDPDGDGCDRLALAGFYGGTTDAPIYLLDGCE